MAKQRHRLDKLDKQIGNPSAPTFRGMMSARSRVSADVREWIRLAVQAVAAKEPIPARSRRADEEQDAVVLATWDAAHGVSTVGARNELRRRLDLIRARREAAT